VLKRRLAKMAAAMSAHHAAVAVFVLNAADLKKIARAARERAFALNATEQAASRTKSI
jgi:hypothetical protein